MNNQILTPERKQFDVITHSSTFIQVSGMAEALLEWGIKRHYSFKIIAEFCGPITDAVISSKGDWVHKPFTEVDRKIIPRSAFKIHRSVRKAGFRDLQVIIGHEIPETQESTAVLPQHTPEVIVPHLPAVSMPKPEIDLGKVVLAAGGLLAGMVGIAAISVGALLGSILLTDPSYCICLDDEFGTVVELLRWNTEA